jgi:hypothetical protein
MSTTKTLLRPADIVAGYVFRKVREEHLSPEAAARIQTAVKAAEKIAFGPVKEQVAVPSPLGGYQVVTREVAPASR